MIERDAVRGILAEMEGETVHLADIAARLDGATTTDLKAWIEHSTDLSPLPADPFTFGRLALYLSLGRGSQSRPAQGRARVEGLRFHVDDLRLERRTCPSCELTHWISATEAAPCPRCGSTTPPLTGRASLIRWSEDERSFVKEESS